MRGWLVVAQMCIRDRYLRAYDDAGNPVCGGERIDALAQSWAVFAGLQSERCACAMQSVKERLIDWDAGVLRLLAPPFDGEADTVGYIAGYVPGVRENGGQYTHAACWTGIALAELGQVEDAWRALYALMPYTHAQTGEGARRYIVEPYVVAGDVYGTPPHTGRGGWTWYTGAAGWLAQFGLRLLCLLYTSERAHNPADGAWMGRERKRGALMDLYRLLLTGENAFSAEGACAPKLAGRYPYVLTLDAATRMLDVYKRQGYGHGAGRRVHADGGRAAERDARGICRLLSGHGGRGAIAAGGRHRFIAWRAGSAGARAAFGGDVGAAKHHAAAQPAHDDRQFQFVFGDFVLPRAVHYAGAARRGHRTQDAGQVALGPGSDDFCRARCV